MTTPTKTELRDALSAAGSAHHDYESQFLNGVRDEQWAGWYAAFALGRLGGFTTPSLLTQWLGEVSGEGDWTTNAVDHVLAKIDG